MKAFSRLYLIAAPAALAFLLGGCATQRDESVEHHRDMGGPMHHGGSMPMHQGGMGGMSGMGASGASGDTGEADVRAMCEKNRQLRSARTPEERWAMMDEPFRSMTPEMRERHLQMMQERCSSMH